MQRELLTRGVIAGVLIAIVFVGILSLPNMQQNQPITDNYDGHTMRVELYIYKNNQLVYYDPDDPAVKNFALFIAEIIAGSVTSGFVSTDGGTFGYIDGSNYDGYVFVSYDSAYSYNYALTNLPANYESGTISEGGVSFDDNEKSITLSASINIQNGGNITGVGIYTYLDVGTYNKYFLLFYDDLTQPMQVSPGDVITVVYKIVVP